MRHRIRARLPRGAPITMFVQYFGWNQILMLLLPSPISKIAGRFLLCGLSVSFLGVLGCGADSGPPRAPVTGTVTHDGSPVSGGSITFAPIGSEQTEAGKPATGVVQSDGTFKLGTYKPGDGAVIGKHRILYSPPSTGTGEAEVPEGEHAENPPPSPYAGLVADPAEIEVASGENKIEVKLVKPGG